MVGCVLRQSRALDILYEIFRCGNGLERVYFTPEAPTAMGEDEAYGGSE